MDYMDTRHAPRFRSGMGARPRPHSALACLESPDRDGGKRSRPMRSIAAKRSSLARIIGRRMASEDFQKAMRAANDSTPATDIDKER